MTWPTNERVELYRDKLVLCSSKDYNDQRSIMVAFMRPNGRIRMLATATPDQHRAWIARLEYEAKQRKFGPYAPRELPEPPTGWEWTYFKTSPALQNKSHGGSVRISSSGKTVYNDTPLTPDVMRCLLAEYDSRKEPKS